MHELNELLAREIGLLGKCAQNCLSEAEIECFLEYSKQIRKLLFLARRVHAA